MWMPMFTNEDDHYEYERMEYERMSGFWEDEEKDGYNPWKDVWGDERERGTES